MKCAGCNREFVEGDIYIEDTSSGFTGKDTDPIIDDLIAGIFDGANGKLRICEDCTEPGGHYQPKVYSEQADA